MKCSFYAWKSERTCLLEMVFVPNTTHFQNIFSFSFQTNVIFKFSFQKKKMFDTKKSKHPQCTFRSFFSVLLKLWYMKWWVCQFQHVCTHFVYVFDFRKYLFDDSTHYKRQMWEKNKENEQKLLKIKLKFDFSQFQYRISIHFKPEINNNWMSLLRSLVNKSTPLNRTPV